MEIFTTIQGINKYAVAILKDKPNYEIEMLLHNRVGSIIKPKSQILNGDIRLLFDINGVTELKTRYSLFKPGKKHIVELIKALKETILQCEKYMLLPDKIVLEPDYIFSNNEDELFFIYYAGEDNGFVSQLKSLVEYYMKVANYEDEEGIKLIYDLYSLIMSEGFGPLALVEFAKKILQDKHNVTPKTEEEIAREKALEELFQSEVLKSKFETEKSNMFKRKKSEEKKDKLNHTLIIMALFIFISLLWIVKVVFTEISSNDIKILIVLLVITTISVIAYINNRENLINIDEKLTNKKSSNNKSSNNKTSDYETSDYKSSLEKSSTINTNISSMNLRNINSNNQEIINNETIKKTSINYCSDSETNIMRQKELVEIKMPYLMKKNKEEVKFLIKKEEMIVGRVGQAVDIELDSRDISRIHAKVYYTGSLVVVEDMGSTNGTYINRSKINKGEKKILENGDNIQFANDEFLFIAGL